MARSGDAHEQQGARMATQDGRSSPLPNSGSNGFMPDASPERERTAPTPRHLDGPGPLKHSILAAPCSRHTVDGAQIAAPIDVAGGRDADPLPAGRACLVRVLGLGDCSHGTAGLSVTARPEMQARNRWSGTPAGAAGHVATDGEAAPCGAVRRGEVQVALRGEYERRTVGRQTRFGVVGAAV
jgi:hypothetical protein